MNINFQIIDGDPSREFLQVKYSNASGQEYYTNLSPDNFTDSDVRSLIEAYAPIVVGYFERTASRDSDMTGITLTGSFTAEAESLTNQLSPPQYPDSSPSYDPWTQFLETGPVDSAGYLTWVVTDMDSAEETAYYDSKVLTLKGERNRLLLESLWIFAEDDSASNESSWLTYRQDLKNITNQAGWPKNITWPTEPSRSDY